MHEQYQDTWECSALLCIKFGKYLTFPHIHLCKVHGQNFDFKASLLAFPQLNNEREGLNG